MTSAYFVSTDLLLTTAAVAQILETQAPPSPLMANVALKEELHALARLSETAARSTAGVVAQRTIAVPAATQQVANVHKLGQLSC